MTADEIRDLREATAKILEGFDAGVFVRDCEHDPESGWSYRLLPYLKALAQARLVLQALDREVA